MAAFQRVMAEGNENPLLRDRALSEGSERGRHGRVQGAQRHLSRTAAGWPRGKDPRQFWIGFQYRLIRLRGIQILVKSIPAKLIEMLPALSRYQRKCETIYPVPFPSWGELIR